MLTKNQWLRIANCINEETYKNIFIRIIRNVTKSAHNSDPTSEYQILHPHKHLALGYFVYAQPRANSQLLEKNEKGGQGLRFFEANDEGVRKEQI